MTRKLTLLVLALPLVFAVAVAAQVVLEDDPCSGYGFETRSLETDERWWPPRTDCIFESEAGGSFTTVTGRSSVFFAVAGWALALLALAAAPLRLRTRVPLAAVASVAALALIFV